MESIEVGDKLRPWPVKWSIEERTKWRLEGIHACSAQSGERSWKKGGQRVYGKWKGSRNYLERHCVPAGGLQAPN